MQRFGKKWENLKKTRMQSCYLYKAMWVIFSGGWMEGWKRRQC